MRVEMLAGGVLLGTLIGVPVFSQASADATPPQGQIVALDVSPELDDTSREALLASCSSVFVTSGGSGCLLGTAERSGVHQAVVGWKAHDSGLQVTVELSGATSGRRVIRVLSFHESSGKEERWQAVGLVVAALVSAEMNAKKSEEPPPPEPAPALPLDRPERTHVVMEIGGAVRQEASPEFVTGGGMMRASIDWGTTFEPTFAVGMLAGTSPVNQLSIRPSVGVGFKLVREPVALTLRFEALALATRWSASDPIGRDSEWHVRYGASLGPTLSVPLTRTLGLFVGAAGTAAFPPVEVRVRGEAVGASSVFAVEGGLGLWARF